MGYWHTAWCCCSRSATEQWDRQTDRQTCGLADDGAATGAGSLPGKFSLSCRIWRCRETVLMSGGMSLFLLLLAYSVLCRVKKKKETVERKKRKKNQVHEQPRDKTSLYSNTTVPPAASRAAFSFSASSLATFARISWGRVSTNFLACFGEDKKESKSRDLSQMLELRGCTVPKQTTLLTCFP